MNTLYDDIYGVIFNYCNYCEYSNIRRINKYFYKIFKNYACNNDLTRYEIKSYIRLGSHENYTEYIYFNENYKQCNYNIYEYYSDSPYINFMSTNIRAYFKNKKLNGETLIVCNNQNNNYKIQYCKIKELSNNYLSLIFKNDNFMVGEVKINNKIYKLNNKKYRKNYNLIKNNKYAKLYLKKIIFFDYDVDWSNISDIINSLYNNINSFNNIKELIIKKLY
jgi:hypothetical protein